MGRSIIKKILTKITPNRLVRFYQFPLKQELEFGTISYSQEGEDLILKRIFGEQKEGFYIDIGAHHPYRFSNTMHFYKKGWRGINVDPLPGMKSIFDKERPKDINIEKGVSNKKHIITYFSFAEPAYNTFDQALAKKREQKSELLETIDVQCLPLSEILQEAGVSEIDFLTIDVEGWELEVLASNDWSRFLPKVIVLEILDFDFEKYTNSEVYIFLQKKGYFLFSKLFHSTILVHKDYKQLVYR
jgi:FkbM family methyltransferase